MFNKRLKKIKQFDDKLNGKIGKILLYIYVEKSWKKKFLSH